MKKKKLQGNKKHAGDKISLRNAQARGEATANRHSKKIHLHKQEVLEKLANSKLPQMISPTFNLSSTPYNRERMLVQIGRGSCGYVGKEVLHAIEFQVAGSHHVALQGNNGSGKSTLLRTILRDPEVVTSGEWHIPSRGDIGYLDQHYGGLSPKKCDGGY